MAGPSSTTRSQARANHATESTDAETPTHDSSSTSSARARSRKTSATGKENGKPMSTVSVVMTKRQGKSGVMGTRAATGTANGKGKDTKVKIKEEFCVCKGEDDGSPMVQCSCCRDWYHFRCIDLSAEDAEEIKVYVCAPCEKETGRRTVMEWEGPEALEPVDDPIHKSNGAKDDKVVKEEKRQVLARAEASESSEDEGSGDEYKEEEANLKKSKGKRPVRRLSTFSESSGDEDSKGATTARSRRTSHSTSKIPASHSKSKSHSPGPNSHHLKRRQSTTTTPQPPTKRKRSESTATDDPTRKYCLGKLVELMTNIFTKHYSSEGQGEGGGEMEKDSDQMKEEREEKAKTYGSQLEQCLYDTYSEPDKQGKASAGGKYKERFRMITFNLQQDDRVHIHKQIASSQTTPERLSTMSSTDLASEETQQSIKEAEKEALAHSILQKTVLPRAKITHKGLEDIEDMNEDISKQRQREQAQEEEARERRERERLARLSRPALPHVSTSSSGGAGPSSGSVPPESPGVPRTPQTPTTWGGPPPVPIHSLSFEHNVSMSSPTATAPNFMVGTRPLFVSTTSDYPQPVEGELNLGDLIHIDDEPSAEGSSTPTSLSARDHFPTTDANAPANAELSLSTSLSPTMAEPSPIHSTTGISPFAASRPDMPPRASFDLSSLWTGPKAEKTEEDPVERAPTPPPNADEQQEAGMDVDMDIDGPDEERRAENVGGGEGDDDHDFDMFLDGDEKMDASVPVVEQSPEEKFKALPTVWTGIINMPLDSTIPQQTVVNAKLVGGRRMEQDSPLWSTLFPNGVLRIDGRVPVKNSEAYLLQSRLNSSKELIAVAFTPNSDDDRNGFQMLSEFLINKDRHGLIFPWGNRGKEWGKELYIIPQRTIDPIPEFMDLLDDLKLPKERSSDCLIGVYVLNRGKLVPPPQSSGLSIPSIVPQMPPPSHHTTTSFPPPIPSVSPPTALPMPPPQIPQSALAAEVASLTPEQIQLMLQALQTTLGPAAANGTLPHPQAHPQSGSPPATNSSWPNSYSPFPPSGTPPNPVPIPQAIFDPPHHDYDRHGPSYGRDDYDDRPGDGYRGGRGRGRARGRGPRRGGRGADDRDRRNSDSGWSSRRGRGRGGGGGGGSSSEWRGGRKGEREAPAFWQ